MARFCISYRSRKLFALLAILATIACTAVTINSAEAIVDSRVHTLSPTDGGVITGSDALFISDGGMDAFPVRKVYFKVDGAKAFSDATRTVYGWITNVDSRWIANGTHKIQSVAVDTSGVAHASAITNFSVNNTNSSTTSTTIATTTTTSTPATTAPTIPPGEKWANHMGVSVSTQLPDGLTADQVVASMNSRLDKAASFGFKWVRISWEQQYSRFDKRIADHAHALGLKIMNTCQRSPHQYPLSNISDFATYCAKFVDFGFDGIEIGNEWNHEPFFNGVDTTYAIQTAYKDQTTAAIRAKSSSIVIINSGWAPDTEHTPRDAMARVLDRSTNFKQSGSGISVHPYAFNCDSIFRCDYRNHPEWNAFLQVNDIVNDAKLKGFDKPVYMTEIGAPSGNGTNIWTGEPYSESQQLNFAKEYLNGINYYRATGMKIAVVFWHTMNDRVPDNSADYDAFFGLRRLNGTEKPALTCIKKVMQQQWGSVDTSVC